MIYGTFIQSPYFWYLISRRQKTSFFLFLVFRSYRDPNEKRKIAQLVFHRENNRGKKIEGRKATRPKRGGPTRLDSLAVWAPPNGASGTSSLGAF